MGCLLRLLASPIRGAAIVASIGLGVFGCAAFPSHDPSPLPDPSAYVRECYPAVEAVAAPNLAAALAPPGATAPVCVRPLQALTLSGGVEGAPFTAGVLVGWTRSGTRPTFDVVSGISSGSLIGAHAFLGPKYDAKLQRLILSLRRTDLFHFRPMWCMLLDGAFGSALPAKCLLRKEFDDEFIDDLRRAHAEGRRFFVGTMNLETKQLAVWDVGAIASSDRPDAGDLVRKILLAAVSWPGAFPPVEFEVEVNGHRYREQHCDAGSVAMAFVRFGSLPGWPPPRVPVAPGWLIGSNLYVLASRKLYSDPAPVRACALPRMAISVSTLFEALTRADIARLYSFCSVSGMRFHLLAVPPEYHGAPPCFTNLFPKGADRLFEVGYQKGVHGPCWRFTPPGGEPGEEAVPRDGMDIAICR